MTTPGKKLASQGTKLEWQNLPRKRCENCGKTFKPKRPGARFDSDKCRYEFHKNGGAFVKLRENIRREVEKQLRFEEDCDHCKGRGRIKQGKELVACPSSQCVNGKQPTAYGRTLLRGLLKYYEAQHAPDPS